MLGMAIENSKFSELPYGKKLTQETASNGERDTLILEGLPQVEIIINQLKRKLPSNIDWDSLRSAGIDGLMQAAERYDATTGNKFSTFAEQRIRGNIIDYIRKTGFGGRAANRFSKTREEATAKLIQVYHRQPTEEELAEEMGMTRDEYRKKVVKYNPDGVMVSLENLGKGDAQKDKYYAESVLHVQPAILGEGGGASASNEFKMKESLKEAIARAGLTEDEKTILNLYFYEDKNLEEASAVMHLHQSRVSQLKNSALKKISGFLARAGYTVPDKFSVYKNKAGAEKKKPQTSEQILKKACLVFGITSRQMELESESSPAKLATVLSMRRHSIPFGEICAMLGLAEKEAKIAAIQADLKFKKDKDFASKVESLNSLLK